VELAMNLYDRIAVTGTIFIVLGLAICSCREAGLNYLQ